MSSRLKLAGWYFPGSRPYGMVLVHGIRANREGVLPEADLLARAGYHLLLVDQRGHEEFKQRVVTFLGRAFATPAPR